MDDEELQQTIEFARAVADAQSAEQQQELIESTL